MPKPQIASFRSSKLPWELFQNFYDPSRPSFFLDSGFYKLPDQNYSYLGQDPFLQATATPEGFKVEGEMNETYPLAEGMNVLRNLLKRYQADSDKRYPFFSGGAVGFFGYEAASLFEQIKFRKKSSQEMPLICFGFYRNIYVYDHQKEIYYLVTHHHDPDAQWEAMKERFTKPSLKAADFSQPFQMDNFTPETSRREFIERVRKIKDYIAEGDIYQANLSQRFQFSFKGSPLKLYQDLRTINPSPFSSFMNVGELNIVSSSPERLIRKEGRHCETRPLAGTRPHYLSSRGEKERRQELLSNEKERAEHIMLVDLERNDLGRVCDYQSVRVEEMMHIEQYSHVIHIVSKIVGTLAKDKDACDLLAAMFPGGTITGCPKIRCMQILDELESVRRELYTGSIGYFDFNGDMDFNIVIRTLILKQNKGYLQVGAGIVHDSDPEKEYEETLHKGEALTQALTQSAI